MKLLMDKTTKEIYGVNNTLVYHYQDKRMWTPYIHLPKDNKLIRLNAHAFSTLYQSFKEHVGLDVSVKLIRAECKLTQEEFAPLMGMTQQAVTRLENGERRETKIHKALLRSIEIINDAGLLPKLMEVMK